MKYTKGLKYMGKAIKFTVLLAVALLLLFPVWLMIVNGLSPNKGMLDMPPRLLPYRWTFENYAAIGRLPNIERATLNSLIVMVTLIVGAILTSSSAAYVFHAEKARWLKCMFWAFMAPIFMTRITVFISQFVIVGKLGIHGLPAVILIPMFWPVGIFLFRNFYATVPDDFAESARMDGASEWRVFSSIMLPLSCPMIGTGVIMLGLTAWGDFMWQKVNLQSLNQQTLLVALMNSTLDVREIQYIGYDLAVGTVLFIPYVVLFALSGRYFVKGITAGGLRG